MENTHWEKIKLISKQVRLENKLEDNEKKILSELEELNFSNDVQTNKNHLLDIIIDFFEKRGYFILFVSLLKTEFTQKFLDSLKEKCVTLEYETFLLDFNKFLSQISQFEIDGKEFLASSKNNNFSDTFFIDDNGTYYNLLGSLNINFTNHAQDLLVNTLFEEDTKRCKLKKLILYDNGHKSVTIEKNGDKENYAFTSDSSCQLIINRFNETDTYSIMLDITSGEIINAELKINGVTGDPKKILDLILSNEKVLINNQILSEILATYFNNEIMNCSDCEYIQNECLPIRTLNDLKNWIPSSVKHNSAPLRKRAKDENQIKTLVCHDMKGGYLEDRYINGSEEENCYFFVHWAAVDIFAYFSHHLVTVPPCSWISAAHTNGVQVIGTFITEWDEGGKIFDEIFTEKNSVFELCMQLIKIAIYYNFDGWLINIENKVKPYQVPLLKYFLKSLTSLMHAYISGSQVIWYDSVLKNGDLRWQSCLNDLNRIFFLNVDAIFLNYNWDEEKLLHSKLQASDRCPDVYVGVDVFGRGKCFTEGGFSTFISVKESRKYGLSAAIFAPGWVYECLEIKEFKENQFKFWDPLQELIPPRIIEDLPYCSSFCPGFGNKMFRNGKVIDDKPWHNMNLQQPQPIYYPSAKSGLTLCTNDAFNGGGCLCLSGNITCETTALEFNIVKTSFYLENMCLVSYTFKPSVQNVDIGLCLDMMSDHETFKLHLVDLNNKKYTGSNPSVKSLIPTSKDQLWEVGYKINEESIEQHWTKRTYLLNSNDFSCHSIQNVSVVASCQHPMNESISFLFGELEISPIYPRYKLMYEDLTCSYSCDDKLSVVVECVLKWQHHSSIFCYDVYVQPLNGNRKFICTTNQSFYKLKCTVNSTSEIAVILCPKSRGSENLSNVSIKIPLEI